MSSNAKLSMKQKWAIYHGQKFGWTVLSLRSTPNSIFKYSSVPECARFLERMVKSGWFINEEINFYYLTDKSKKYLLNNPDEIDFYDVLPRVGEELKAYNRQLKNAQP